MEEYQVLAKKAFSSFKTADHLTYITLPLVKDKKLILTILENLSLALINAMNALLEHERYYKRISPLPKNFETRFYIFRTKLLEKFNITEEELNLIKSLKLLIEKHKEAPVEFIKNDKFVICSENYRMKTININEIKDYLTKTRNFLRKVKVGLNDRQSKR